jgi:hypothetical protein
MDKTVGTLLYHIATKLKSQIKNRMNILIEYVIKKKLLNEPQLNGRMTVKYNLNISY